MSSPEAWILATMPWAIATHMAYQDRHYVTAIGWACVTAGCLLGAVLSA